MTHLRAAPQCSARREFAAVPALVLLESRRYMRRRFVIPAAPGGRNRS